MAQQILSQSKLYAAGYDFSGDLKGIALRLGADVPDNTTFASGGTRSRLAGLRTGAFSLDGFWNISGSAVAADDTLFGNVGLNDIPVTIAPQTGAEGEVVYFTKANFVDYVPGAKVGELFAFNVSGESTGEVVRGVLLHNAARTSGGNGTITNVGAVSATQKAYAALHVLALTPSGSPSFTCKIQSAALVGFGSPTDRITFTAATAVGGQWATPVAGAITDAYWRIVYTLTNISSITFAVSFGIK